ncbi:MAG: hypothetical protein A2589_02690 [Candidatus Vogelbacteria bacterium RIFOXYD1_FULL_46_19]|uniref:Protease PrsW n=1 Tax=Candidatus Vogelbacteria bacterium RIFOXYD1_FULL_46_19 TaxID=1802439 RepID=A0A1G2QIX7_9BACT|nr:MAG: hypothetical protein A2589_02690 [Candidatus Vogelbacteria bacterium RIFOXYD1_FULL_46_19]
MDFEWTMSVFALLGGLLPALVWLWFWLREDKARPEPSGLILSVFLAGGFGVVMAFFLQRLTNNGLHNLGWDNFSLLNPTLTRDFFFSSIGFLALWAAIEEVMKLLAAYFIAFRHHSFDEPIDAMIYLIVAAIGFSAVENSLFLLNTIMSGETNLFFALTGNLRFLGATVVHIVSSSLVGGMIALSFCHPRLTKVMAATIGLCTATILHTVFNFFIITSSGQEMLQIFALLWLLAIFIIYFFEKVKNIICSTPTPDINPINQ